MLQYTTKTYILPERSRSKLQTAWGTPLLGNEEQVAQQYQQFLKEKKFKLIITIGDYCSHHLKSDIKIFDEKVQRQAFQKREGHAIELTNPAGTIQKEAWPIIKQSLKEKTNVRVQGEEDLLVIPAVIQSPLKTLIIYGFPRKGICLLEITPKLKKEFQTFLTENFQIKNP